MIFLIFILGLVVGSFINCVIYRLHQDQSFIKGRSFCPYCKHKLGVLDLIPVFSFIFLKRKCRYCAKKISWQYPIVELTTALTFSFIFWQSEFQFAILFRNLFFAAVLIIIFIYDLKYQLVAEKIIFPAVIIAFPINIFLKISWLDLFLGAIIGSSFFLFQYLISRGKWIGFGDVYIGFLMGVMLGVYKIVLAIMLSYFIGSIIAIILIILKKETLKSKIALGPFLVIGTFVALLYGERILDWYLNKL